MRQCLIVFYSLDIYLVNENCLTICAIKHRVFQKFCLPPSGILQTFSFYKYFPYSSSMDALKSDHKTESGQELQRTQF